MTNDMPTVDGARTEAERLYTYPADLLPEPTTDWREVTAFVAGAEWLAPTVAALEAEVERLREEVEQQRDMAGEWASRTTQTNARADAAEAVIERVRGIVTDWGAGTVHRPRSPYYDRLRAALSDAAPQAVAAPEVVETRCGCRTNEAGDVRCHKCGQYVNIRCWTCNTPRGEGPCPNPVPATDGREEA